MGIVRKVPVHMDQVARSGQLIGIGDRSPVNLKYSDGLKLIGFRLQVHLGFYAQYFLYQGIL